MKIWRIFFRESEVADFEVVHMKRASKAFAAERRCLEEARL